MSTEEKKAVDLEPIEPESKPLEVWSNSLLWLKDIDWTQERFKIKAFLNVYWRVDNIESMHEIEKYLIKYNKPNLHYGCLFIDLLPYLSGTNANIEADKIKHLIEEVTPFGYLFEPDWFFVNSTDSTCSYYLAANLFKKSENIWYMELSFEGYFGQGFEFNDFPFDNQILNIYIGFTYRGYKFVHQPPKWLVGKGIDEAMNDWGHNMPITMTILEPAKKEWELFPPWIEDRVNRVDESRFLVIQLRVRRKSMHYVLYNILPLVLIVGLSFVAYAMNIGGNNGIEQLGFIATLLLTIAAGRSELVPEMPNAAYPSSIDLFVTLSYPVFAIMMIGIAINMHFGMESDWHWIIAAIIYVIALCPFVFAKCKSKCRGDEIWEIRRKRDFGAWSAEYEYDKFLDGTIRTSLS